MLISTIVYSSFLKYSCIGTYTVKVYIIYSLLYPDDTISYKSFAFHIILQYLSPQTIIINGKLRSSAYDMNKTSELHNMTDYNHLSKLRNYNTCYHDQFFVIHKK